MHLVVRLHFRMHIVDVVGKNGNDDGGLYHFVFVGIAKLIVEHGVVVVHHSVPECF